jgi:general secretion pathway protein A
MMNKRELSALQQRIGARAHLRPLSLPEVRAYIAERLHLAGQKGTSPFPSATIEAIHQYASGVPRLINLVCDACLSVGFRTQSKIIKLDVVEEVAVSLGLLEPAKVEASERQAIPAPIPVVTGMQRSIVDVLIDSMKQNRSATLE